MLINSHQGRGNRPDLTDSFDQEHCLSEFSLMILGEYIPAPKAKKWSENHSDGVAAGPRVEPPGLFSYLIAHAKEGALLVKGLTDYWAA